MNKDNKLTILESARTTILYVRGGVDPAQLIQEAPLDQDPQEALDPTEAEGDHTQGDKTSRGNLLKPSTPVTQRKEMYLLNQ